KTKPPTAARFSCRAMATRYSTATFGSLRRSRKAHCSESGKRRVQLAVFLSLLKENYRMFQSRSRIMLAPISVVVLLAAQCYAADEPKDVTVAFYKTVKAGDKKSAHDFCIGSAEQFKILDALIDMTISIYKL